MDTEMSKLGYDSKSTCKRSKISTFPKEEADIPMIRYLPSLYYIVSVHLDAMASVALAHRYYQLPFLGVPPIDNLDNTLVSNCFPLHSLQGCTEWWAVPKSSHCSVLLSHSP